MLIDPIYYIVLYDIDLPFDIHHAMNKRVSSGLFRNITDGLEGKIIETGKNKYTLIDVKTFSIINTVDNHLFAICNVKKL